MTAARDTAAAGGAVGAGHTPGPWAPEYDEWDDCWIVKPYGGEPHPNGPGWSWSPVAKCDLDEGVNEANAHLIAAAPDMLAALQLHARAREAGLLSAPELWAEAADAMDAAIARATAPASAP